MRGIVRYGHPKNFGLVPIAYILYASLVMSSASGGVQPLVLHDDTEQYVPTHSMQYFIDSTASLGITDIVSPTYRSRFTRVRGAAPSFAPSKHAIWVIIDLTDSTTGKKIWRCSFSYPMVDSIIQFEQRDTEWHAAGIWTAAEGSNDRALQSRLPVFALPLLRGRQTSIIFRLTSFGSIPLLMHIRTVDDLRQSQLHDQLMLGGFYGILLIMIVYNFLLFFSVRDTSYLLYGLYAGCFGFYEFFIDGLYREYLHEYVPLQLQYVILPMYLSIIWGILFARKYLNTKVLLPIVDRMMQVFMVVVIVATLIVPPQWIDKLSALFILIYLAICVAAGILTLRKGFRPAVYYLVAVTGFAGGLLLRSLRISGVLPMTEFIQNAAQIGFLWEVSIFSFALGNRINTMRDEKEREKEQIRLRIADDLHDEIGSNLSSIVVQSQLMKRDLHLDAEHAQRMDEISEIAMETGDAMRDIVWFINPENDDPEEMARKMTDTARQLLECEHVEINIDPSVFQTLRDLQIRRNLFFIFKEALTNITRHAGAANVFVRLHKEASHTVVLEVRDDGVGFENREQGRGHGLQSFRNRAHAMNAEFDIKSSPHKGTTLLLRLKTP